MSEDAWLHRAATDEEREPQIPLTGAGVTEDVASNFVPEEFPSAANGQSPAPAPQGQAHLGARQDGDSPDLLRWRAEMLLDEMMVGAVDASAGDQGGGFRAPAGSTADLRMVSPPWESPTRESASHEANAGTRPTRAPRPIVPGTASTGSGAATSSDAPDPYTNGAHRGRNGVTNGAAVERGANGNGRAAEGKTPPSTAQKPAPASLPPYQPAAVSRLTPPPADPAPALRERPTSTPRRLNGRGDASYPPPAPTGGTVSAPGERHPYDDEPSRKLTAVEQRYPRPGTRRAEPIDPVVSNGQHGEDPFADDPFAPGLGPIRRNPAVIRHDPVAGAMAVGHVGSRYTSKYAHLLPRSTPWDEHEMEREIASLADEMARVLPSGHESSRRARHLLEKAQTIFASDPLRSAEVDYYLSQVRAIVQRSRQTVQWSGHYRKQLVLYQTAWLLFSGMLVAAGVLYGGAITDTLAGWFGWSADAWLTRSIGAGMIALFSGSFGGALGGLLNLQRYHRLELGYVDRKYSLRGLILPLMGMLIGLVLFGIVAGAGALVGMGGAWPLWLELTPALLAFLLGLLQESIYGTRE